MHLPACVCGTCRIVALQIAEPWPLLLPLLLLLLCLCLQGPLGSLGAAPGAAGEHRGFWGPLPAVPVSAAVEYYSCCFVLSPQRAPCHAHLSGVSSIACRCSLQRLCMSYDQAKSSHKAYHVVISPHTRSVCPWQNLYRMAPLRRLFVPETGPRPSLPQHTLTFFLHTPYLLYHTPYLPQLPVSATFLQAARLLMLCVPMTEPSPSIP